MSARRHSVRSSASSSMSDEAQFNLLPTKEVLESDPLSPGLPSMVPNHGRKPMTLLKRLIKAIPWLVVAGILLWMSSAWYSQAEFRTDISYLKQQGSDFELVHDEKLPEEPMAVMVKDLKGKSRWTMSIPSSIEFPLRPQTYSGLCSQMNTLKGKMSSHMGGHAVHTAYYKKDDKFIDVAEAENIGVLPSNTFTTTFAGSSNFDSESNMDENGVCKRSLTFVMETKDASFGHTLMLLWMSYGLAKKENRAFFIDDRHWPYGKYSTFFKPPPDQPCLPPPEHHKLPCPHQANHLLVSAATQSVVFGHQFNEEFQDPRAMRVMRQKKIFGMLREGYENLFKLADGDAKYVNKRVEKLNSMVRDKGGLEFGVHVRHGDRHPWEFQYQKSYVPLDKYVDTARELVDEAYNDTKSHEEQMASKMIVASDDPEVFASQELSFALRAQERIIMASKSHVDAAEGGTKKVDDSVGWEGGFFSNVFWGLGDPSPSNNAAAQRKREEQLEKEVRVEPTELALQLRELVGKSYLLDLSVVGQTDRIICTVSSIGCRLLAVMMGWEKAIMQNHWVNIDGEFEWSGIRW